MRRASNFPQRRPAHRFGVRLVALALGLACLGCSTLDRTAVRVERLVLVGSEEWDQIVDDAIADCRALDLPTPEERQDCIAPVMDTDTDVVAPGVTAVVALLRAYWIASGSGAGYTERVAILGQIAAAASTLPPEAFEPLIQSITRGRKPAR